MSSFELLVSKIKAELSYFDIYVQRGLLFAGVHVRAERFLIKSYFRNGLKVNGSWIYSVQNCLEELHNPEFPNVIVDPENLGRQPEPVCKFVFMKLKAFTEEKPQAGR
jgi:hypothetical protein